MVLRKIQIKQAIEKNLKYPNESQENISIKQEKNAIEKGEWASKKKPC